MESHSAFSFLCCLKLENYLIFSLIWFPFLGKGALSIKMAKTGKVVDRVVSYMKAQILSGAWPLGSKLPSENQLCLDLNCSRSSIRSALQQFSAIGAVESVHGKGSFLRSTDLRALGQKDEPISYPDLIDLLDFAALVWPSVCVSAAERNDLELFCSLNELVRQMRCLTSNQIPALAELTGAFHQTIARSLSNDTLQQIFSWVLTQIASYPCTGNHATVYYSNVYYHDLLLTAMQHRNPERICAVINDYFLRVKHDFYRVPVSSEAPSGN